jgi:hypothetical protein
MPIKACCLTRGSSVTSHAEARFTSGSLRLHQVFALFVLLATTLTVAAADDPGARLDAMSRAFRTLDYHGVFTYEQGQTLSSHRIVHAVAGGIERERILRPRGGVHRCGAAALDATLPETEAGPGTHHHCPRHRLRSVSGRQRRRHPDGAPPALQPQRPVPGRHSAALLLFADPQARAPSSGRWSMPRSRAARSSFSAPTARRMPSHARRSMRLRLRRHAIQHPSPASNCMPRRSRPPARSTGWRDLRAIHGAAFYGLARNSATITLVKQMWTVPGHFDFGAGRLVPLRADEAVAWALQN